MADRFGYGEIGLDINPCRGCDDYDAPYGCKSNGGCGKPITNADRIRAMTDAELAEWLSDMHDSVTCPNGGAINCNPSCKRCWLDWLKEGADDGMDS